MKYRPVRPEHFLDRENATPMGNFWSIAQPILRAARPSSIVEIGSAEGHTSRLLAREAADLGAVLHVVDPILDPASNDLGDHATIHAQKSVEFLEKGIRSGCWFIDGDHNHRTVTAELQGAFLLKERDRPFVVLLHDVGFPWGRRDMFYDPADATGDTTRGEPGIDEEEILSHPNLGEGTLVRKESGGPANGVLTAVEDFMSRHEGRFGYLQVPAFFGMGILWDNEAATPELERELDAIRFCLGRMSPLLQNLEANRLRLLQSYFRQNDQISHLSEKLFRTERRLPLRIANRIGRFF